MKPIKSLALAGAAALVGYLAFAPVAIDPVAWQAPANQGYTGSFAQNQHLSQVTRVELNGEVGPEDLDLGPDGLVYFSLLSGSIQRINAQNEIEEWVNTGGRPLGIEFDANGHLIVADAMKGLLSISPEKQITVLLQNVDGKDLRYADDLDIARDGKIYLSDASTKFYADVYGTYGASLLDINEHGGHGRLIEFDPQTGKALTLLDGLNFANGVALSHDQQSVLINETGSYRVLRVGLYGEQRGQADVVIDNLPGFPDNLAQGNQGLYWLGLVSPRSAALDALSAYPTLRKVVQRLPAFMRPKAQNFGHVIAINDAGEVIHNLQDPLGMYGQTTGALEVGERLYISSLHETALALTANPNSAETVESAFSEANSNPAM